MNTQTLKYIEQLFVTKQILIPKNGKNYNFEYNGYKVLIKYIQQKLQGRHFCRSQKSLKYKNCRNFENTVFRCLGFQMYTLKTVLCIIQPAHS